MTFKQIFDEAKRIENNRTTPHNLSIVCKLLRELTEKILDIDQGRTGVDSGDSEGCEENEVQQLKQAFELYEEALDSSCECGLPPVNPSGSRPCRYCNRIEKARRIATKIIGEYKQT
jgi:hypothetical protein